MNEDRVANMRTIARQVFGITPPEKLVERLCAAQAFWISGMAWNVVDYRKKHDSDKVVVLAGTLHAVKNGVPNCSRLTVVSRTGLSCRSCRSSTWETRQSGKRIT